MRDPCEIAGATDAVAVGGFLAYRAYNHYESALDRAERWEARARELEPQAKVAYDRGYRTGKRDATNEPINRAGISGSGWYIVRIEAPNNILRLRGAEEMAECRHYWIWGVGYTTEGTVGRSIDEPC